MRKKILLLFSLIILCVPLLKAQDYSLQFSGYQCYQATHYTSVTVDAGIRDFTLQFSNGKAIKLLQQPQEIQTFDKHDLTTAFSLIFKYDVEIREKGWNNKICPGEKPTESLLVSKSNSYQKKSAVTFFGTDINGVESEIKTFHNVVSNAMLSFSTDEYNKIRRYTNIRISITQEENYISSEITLGDQIVDINSVSLDYHEALDEYDQNFTTLIYSLSNATNENIVKTISLPLMLTGGDLDTKITGVDVTGGTTTNNVTNIANSGFGVISITECKLSSMAFSLLNVDFDCQVIKSMVLKDASGNIKNTISPADYTTVGSNQISLSLSNISGIKDNDKLVIALTNECTMINPEMDYTIVLSTEGKDQNNKFYINTELFPGGSTKVPIAITQKSGTKWCDNSSAFFFNVSGPNGYTNINFSNASPDGSGSYSVAIGQSSITGTANFYKCLTGVNIPVPATKMPKTPVIADLEYCNGTNFNFPINNPSDYTTETFRLLLDGTEKVGWQGTKTFSGINLGKVGTASAVVESTNGECFISSSPATIASRIQPIALTFVGSLSYYTEQVNTTLVQTTQQDGVTYKIFKDGSSTPQDSWIGIKAQTLTKGSYRITTENANVSCSAETNLVIVEKDLNIGSAWVTTDLSFCQLEGTKDLNTFVSFNGTSSVVFTSTAGLSITGSNVDLASSTAGTYVITCTAIKDGVTKVFIKNFTVKPKANDIAISLLNTSNFSCNTDNPQLQVTTDYPGYSYSWSKGGTVQSGNARVNTIALTKAEGSQNFSVVATASNGCLSSPSPVLSLVKNNLTADVNFTSGTGTFCQSIAGTANIFDDLTGADKISVSQEQGGFTYTLSSSSSDLILVNRNKIDLERSKAGTYTITMAYSQNGCTKSITKQYVIKQMPSVVIVTLENASTLECDMNNVNANLRASHNAYSYNWYKKGSLLTDNTQSVSVPVSKADGVTNLYAFPVLDGCLGLKTNEVSVTKRYVEANVAFTNTVTEYCQKTGGSIDIFTELSGTDKIAVVNSQSGYTWTLTPSGSGLKVTGSTINLETSQAGTYTLTMTISKDGCSKTITKDVMIRMRPADFTIALTNSTDFACNNSAAAMAASVTSYTYKWYKAGTDVGTGTTLNIPIVKTDITDASRSIYAIGTAANTCETNPSSIVIAPLKTFLEADLSMGNGTATYCQSPFGGKTDIFDLLVGADKLAVTTNQHYTWSITAPGLILSSAHEIDLQLSPSGTYTVSFTYQNEAGCAKTLTKTVVIKPKPSDVTISLQNASTVECDMSNPNALIKADNPSYTYNWYKKTTLLSDNTQSVSIPVSKADGLTYILAYPVLDGCIGKNTNSLSVTKRYVEANVSFTNNISQYCQQTGGTLDIFTELLGADKTTVANSQNGYTWTVTPSGVGLKMTGSIINLETSQAGTYTVSMVISKDGCSKTITKDLTIKAMPMPVSITLQNAETIECDMNNVNALLKADNAGYTYRWIKKGVTQTDNTQSISIPVSKADGRTFIYALPMLDGCFGPQTNIVSVTKRYVEANVAFTNTVTEYCQKTGGSIDIFTELSGTDKIAVVNSQSGYTWTLTPSGSGLKVTGSTINLETSQAGTYTLTMVISKDECTKTITKDVMIRQRPADFTIALTNSTDFACNNSAAAMAASVTSYTYNWFKNGVNVGTGTTLNIPVTKLDVSDASRTIYAIGTAVNTCETNPSASVIAPLKTFLEADISISSDVTSFCQTPDAKTTDIFDFLSGADKLAVTTKQHYDWSIVAPGLILSSTHEIDLNKSAAGTYSIAFNYHNDGGCAKTLNKTIVIKPKPSNVIVTLENAATIECDLTNPNALVKADNSAYNYDWYKQGVKLVGNTQSLSVPVSKVDGLTSIYATPFLDGCAGAVTNTVTLTKRFVEADFGFTDGVSENCQTVGSILDTRSLVTGADKDKVLNEQGGYTWNLGYSSTGLLYIDSRNSIFNLEKSFPQTYTSSFNLHKDGCTKTFTKDIKIKPRPIEVEISMLDAASVACNNSPILFKAAIPKYEYKWLSNEKELTEKTAALTLPLTKADGLVAVYAIPVLDGCAGIKTNAISTQKFFIEADLKFSAGNASYCQYPATKVDLFTEVSGTDKLAIEQKQAGWDWSFVSSSDLIIAGSVVDLEKSKAGTYTVSMVLTKDGCTKTLNKTVIIKAQPVTVGISLQNASTIECDMLNTNALVKAENSLYSYNWYKKGALQTENTQAVSVPVSKLDGATSIYAIPVLDGCIGLKSNDISVTKRFIEADLKFSDAVIEYCQKDNGTVDLFVTHLIGADRDAVKTKANGFDWNFVAPAALVINNGIIDLQKSSAGSYDVNLIITKDGCSKTLNKTIVIKAQPGDVSITLTNSTDFSCNADAATLQASVNNNSYEWFKNDVLIVGTDASTSKVTVPVSKADGVTKFYAVGKSDNGCAARNSNVVTVDKRFVEANLEFSTGNASYCQYPATKVDLFTEVSGTDKLAIEQKQAGWDWSFVSSSDLIIAGSVVDLEKSKAGTYTVSMVLTKDGCTKTLNKTVIIKAQPVTVGISLQNASTIECDMTNTNALVKAENSLYSYNWYKKGALLTENTQAISVPVSKLDGATSIYAIPVLNGCVGLKSNDVSVTKRFIEADLKFSDAVIEYCQKDNGTVDLFVTHLIGADRDAVKTKANGFDWNFVAPAALVINNGIIDLQKSSAGSYDVNLIITKDGCSKTLNKTIVIKAQPGDVSITLTNSTDFSCNADAATLQASVNNNSYEWFKNDVLIVGTDASTSKVTVPVSKADGVTKFYAVGKSDNGCAARNSNVITVDKRFVEANLKFSDGIAAYCQYPATKVDLFTEVSGTDKLAIQGKQNGWDWSFNSSADLVVSGSVVDLEKSKAGTYTVSLVLTKDGCSKTLTKTVEIKAQPVTVEISLQNASTIECDMTNTNALVKAENSLYSYNWYKKGALLTENTQAISVPVSKLDGATSIYAIPVLNGCIGLKSNNVSVTKRHVEADLIFSAAPISYCQYPAAKVDLFTEVSGTDKLAIQGKQNGWDWAFFSSTDLFIDGSVVDLEKSKAGSYTVNLIITKDGCTKTISKVVAINPIPAVITLEQLADVTCNKSNEVLRVISPDNYTYKYYRNGIFETTNSEKQSSFKITKADGVVQLYAIPVSNLGCIGLQSNTIKVEKKDVEVNFGFNDKAISVPSKDEVINLFDYTSGTDKDVIINQKSGYAYKMAFLPVKQTSISSTDGTIIPASGIQSGDTQYLLNVVVSKDGCDTIFTKTATIKAIPRNITIDFATKKDVQECSSSNYVNVIASDATLKYKWYKNDILVPGDTYQATIEVFKSDKEVKIFAIPSTSEGVAGYKTNDLLTTKRYVSADIQLDSKAESFCSVAGKKINIFDYVRGADKAAVIAGQYGYSFQTSGDCGLAVADNKYIDFDNSLSEDNSVYNVSLTVAQNGCTSTQTKSITIKKRPEDITIELMTKASNTADKNLFCAGDSLELKASTSTTSDAVYNWYKGTELLATTKVPNLKYKFVDPSGTINLSASSVYENGCQSTASNVVTVQKKDVTFSINMAAEQIAYCPEAKKINLFDYVSGDDKNDVMNQNNNCSYVFSASGNNGLAISSYSFLDLDNSTYSSNPYSLTLNVNKQGCVKSFTRQISIKPRPVTPLVALTSNSELRYCGGDVVTLTDKNTQTGTYYKWNVNGTDITGSSSSILKYTTDQASEIGVQAISYFNSNSCPSKASDVLKVINVVPKVDIKLINTTVTVNDLIQFYVFESTAGKSIKLTATRVSDKTLTDLPYTREGNVITLSGILPIGEYSFSAIAENVLTGYCSQNIVIDNTLTVTNSTRETANSTGVILVPSSDEIARKSIYDEYMAQLKKGEVHSILLPILTASNEPAKLSVFTTDDNESVIIRVVDIQGHVISSRTEFLLKGENDFTIKGDDKPVVPGMYLINIDYSKAHKSETLKGLVK